MAEFPALPFFTDAYLGDTMHLSLEEHGAYLKMLMIAWRSPDCGLPDDDHRIARMLGISPFRWSKLRPVIEPFWAIADGRWTQKRLKKVRSYVESVAAKKREAANVRWNGKALEDNNPGDAPAPASAPPPAPASAMLRARANPNPNPNADSESLPNGGGSDAPARENAAAAELAGLDVERFTDALMQRAGPAGGGRAAIRASVQAWVAALGAQRVAVIVADALRQARSNPVSLAGIKASEAIERLEHAKAVAAIPLPEQPDPWLEAIRRSRQRDEEHHHADITPATGSLLN